MIDCSTIFGRTYIKSYQEFYLAMTVGAECGRRGICLDMSMMSIVDPKLLSKHDKAYLRYLKSIGSVYDGTQPEKTIVRNSKEDYPEDRSDYWFDVDKFTELGDRLFRSKEDGYHWDHEWAYEVYGDKYLTSLTSLSLMGNLIMHLTGHMIVSFIVGDLEPKKIYFHFNRMEARATYIYLPLYACTCTCENIKNLVELDFMEMRKELRDLDYYVLYESSRNSGLFTLHPWRTKRQAMDIHKFKQGSLVAMYHRVRISANNPAGTIKEAYIARIDKLDDSDEFVITNFAVNKTIEEQELDYLEIDESMRSMFIDMLDFRIPSTQEKMSFFDVGVCEYFYTEEWLLLPLDKADTVSKRITIDGVQVTRDLNTVDAVYWIMCQHGVDFDKALFKSMYNDGRDLLWDTVDGTPYLITDTIDLD